ncbi:MAG: cadmium-translocating P-type ATPase [Alphaproteobacteria bacterium]|nr:cadmium-translocating P-type ATPase [Alphaproteobacteria bacterium]
MPASSASSCSEATAPSAAGGGEEPLGSQTMAPLDASGMTGDPAADPAAFVLAGADGTSSLHLMVEGITCGACVQRIERALARQPDVASARVNLSTRRLVLAWRGGREQAAALVGTVERLGFRAVPFEPTGLDAGDRREERELLRALAVAGFGAGNVMLVSVAVWAGHAQDMGEATRALLHWVSALIALPCICFAVLPFLRSAWRAVRSGRTNMDVPIAVGVTLASAASLFETVRGGPHVYFDSAATLLFFLLIGRFLDRRVRAKARSAAERLLALRAEAASVLRPDGSVARMPAAQVEVGMTVLVAAGERIPVDGTVVAGASEIDTSLINGETLPAPVAAGAAVHAGMLNLAAPIRLRVTAVGEGTLLAEIVRLMELAEQRRARYVAIADRLVRWYTPAVHALAAAAFLAWHLGGGLAWQQALMIAVAVLIVTCPCALGLAVPVVQVIASGRLLRSGVLLKSATAIERLAQVTMVVFDKTGTLTAGAPALRPGAWTRDDLAAAAAVATASRHPLARALCRAADDGASPGTAVVPVTGVQELPGRGLQHDTPAGPVRVGNRAFCGVALEDSATDPELWLARPGRPAVQFAFRDPVRADAAAAIARLRSRGLRVAILSGDRAPAVAAVAAELGIEDWRAACSPQQKCDRLAALGAEGERVMMVGDGLNDAPALAAAFVSASPASAADVSQTAADAVFQGARLAPVVELLDVAGRADGLVRQNFLLALGYNVLTVPLAMAGVVTPLIAAAAMSSSSILVTGNAFRLLRGGRP